MSNERGRVHPPLQGMMAARTVDWRGQRESSKWRPPARDHPFLSQVLPSPPPSRAHHKPRRPQLQNSTPNARLSTRVDTTSSSSRFTQHAPAPPFTSPLSISSKLTPHSSPRPSSSRITSLQPAVIDLTVHDTEDELSVCDMDILVPNATRSAPNRLSLSSAPSTPLRSNQSLFTPPPPPRRRMRLFIDYLQVPPFPNGLTKADYQPMSLHSVAPPPGPTITNMPHQRPLSPQTRKGKERRNNVVSPCKRCAPDMSPNALLDAFYEPKEIPLYDDDTYPPLIPLDLATNSRFQFAHAWRAHASKLREAERDWTLKFGALGKASIWAQSVDTLAPRVPGTTGYVSIQQLMPWELVPPENSTEHVSDEEAPVTVIRTAVDAEDASLHHDALPAPSVPVDPALSDSTLSQAVSSTVVDTEHDMNQYFNGLGDSQHTSGQQLPLTDTFSPRLPHSNSSGLRFPSLGVDLQLADASGHEPFFGVPPSPTVDMGSSLAPSLNPDSPIQSASCFSTSKSIVFAPDAPSASTLLLEQGESLLLDDLPPLTDDVPSTALGTINPSLLGGPEQSQTRPLETKRTSLKRRSNLPQPVIYVRRPMDPSSLPVASGKRPVQIKYRDLGGPLETPSTHEDVASLDQLSSNETNETKRRSIPSRKLGDADAASVSGSDYIPETSSSKIKTKIKRSVPSYQDTEAETVPKMSFCHQCRNKSVRPKMTCSNTIDGRVCGKRFCNRCVQYRYPDVTFDEHSAGFLCPVCTNTCNCSACSRNRGEEFVSMRLGGLAASIFKSKVTLVRDAEQPQHEMASQPALPMQTHFWAHVYGIEGEHVGSAFTPHEQIERLNAPSSLSAPPKVSLNKVRMRKEKQPRGPRVFIGRPLASWKVRAVRDVEPGADMDVRVGVGKGKEKGRSQGRWYVGSFAALHEPYGCMPGSESPTPPSPSSSSRCTTPVVYLDGSLTPLSELEADQNWPQPEVGECCEWAPPPPPGRRSLDPCLTGVAVGGDTMRVDARGPSSMTLSEQDLARAISAALAAVSVEPPC